MLETGRLLSACLHIPIWFLWHGLRVLKHNKLHYGKATIDVLLAKYLRFIYQKCYHFKGNGRQNEERVKLMIDDYSLTLYGSFMTGSFVFYTGALRTLHFLYKYNTCNEQISKALSVALIWDGHSVTAHASPHIDSLIGVMILKECVGYEGCGTGIERNEEVQYDENDGVSQRQRLNQWCFTGDVFKVMKNGIVTLKWALFVTCSFSSLVSSI